MAPIFPSDILYKAYQVSLNNTRFIGDTDKDIEEIKTMISQIWYMMVGDDFDKNLNCELSLWF